MKRLALVAASVITVLLTGCTAPAPGAGAHEEPGIVPVIDRDFPDPDVLLVDGTWFAYATNDAESNVQVATSTDLLEWTALPDAMPVLPDWVEVGDTWAPDVAEVGGGFVLYFTAYSKTAFRQCIGVATATDPAGPFTAVGDDMLVCPSEEGGAIDASTFVDDDGSRWLLWKNDGNCCRLDTWISVAPLTDDGLALAGEPTRLDHAGPAVGGRPHRGADAREARRHVRAAVLGERLQAAPSTPSATRRRRRSPARGPSTTGRGSRPRPSTTN